MHMVPQLELQPVMISMRWLWASGVGDLEGVDGGVTKILVPLYSTCGHTKGTVIKSAILHDGGMVPR